MHYAYFGSQRRLPLVAGYAGLWGVLSLPDDDGIVWRIQRGAFSHTLGNAFAADPAERTEVRLCWRHDESIVLASTRDRSLGLREDVHGLYWQAWIADNDWGRDAFEMIRGGELGVSPAGMARSVRTAYQVHGQALTVRTISEYRLSELSLTNCPRWPYTYAYLDDKKHMTPGERTAYHKLQQELRQVSHEAAYG